MLRGPNDDDDDVGPNLGGQRWQQEVDRLTILSYR
jgi:hypothetical protein